MICRLIVDAEGPNPDFDPPNPAVDPCGFQAYSVPHTVVVPAGTVLPEDPLAWVHCFPQAGVRINPRTRRPERGPLGPLLAEPVDAECRAAFEKHLPGWAASQKLSVDQARKKIADLVAAAKAVDPGPAPATPSV